MLSTAEIACPYCGEPLTLLVDASAGSQRYVEDCQVCCRPIVVDVAVGGEGGVDVRVKAEDDA